MIKKYTCAAGLSLLIFGLLVGACGGSASSAASAGSFTPTRNVEWYVASGSGGGSDIFTRIITDVMMTEGFTTANLLVTNKTDGGGEIARAQVAKTTGILANHTLMTFNSGDLTPMVSNTAHRIANFKPLALMAVDKQIIFIGKSAKYKTFREIIGAVEAGKIVVLGGSKGDDVITANMLLKEMGWTTAQMPYITYDSSNDAITAILGNHVDIIISKPAAASSYVEAGQMIPILALSTERYSGDLAGAPTLSELGDYNDVEVPVWRGVVGPAAMSSEAQAYWSGLLKKVSETESWKTNYLDKFKLLSDYKDFEETAAYMTAYQNDYMAAQGIK